MCWRPVGRCPGRQHSKRMPAVAVAVVVAADVTAVAAAAAAVGLDHRGVVPELSAEHLDSLAPVLGVYASSTSVDRVEKHSHAL
jgi:hypothetical protein